MSQSRYAPSRFQECKPRAVVEARDMICAIPRAHDATKLSWLFHAAGQLAIHFRLAKKLYYREVKRIDADTMDRMRIRFEEIQEAASKRRELMNELAIRTKDLRSPQGGRGPVGDIGGTTPPRK